jgi:hypothetical protein
MKTLNRKAIVMKKTLALHKVVLLVATLAIGSVSVASNALAAGGGVDGSFISNFHPVTGDQGPSPFRSYRGR